MKKTIITSLFALMLFSGCDYLSQLTKFDMSFTNQITLPAAPASSTPVTITTPDIQTKIDSVLNSYKLSSDLIQSITLKKMEFVVSTPVGSDLTFLKSVNLYITATGLTDVKIAGIDNVPDNTGNTLALNMETVDIKNFLLKDKFQLKLVTTTDKATTVEQQLSLSMTLLVDLKILGL